MPHPKVKSENYVNFGGINTKVSPYATGPHEFLNLVNFDFQTPGSLSTRFGSTQYLNSSASYIGEVLSLVEFEKTTGFSQIVWSQSGVIWYGATTGVQTQMSYGPPIQAGFSCFFRYDYYYFSSTLNDWNVETSQNLSYWNDPTVTLGSSNLFQISPFLLNNNRADYNTFNNLLFSTNGQNLANWDGSSLFPNVDVIPTKQVFFGAIGATFILFSGTVSATFKFLSRPVGVTNYVWTIYNSFLYTDGRESEVWPTAHFRPQYDSAGNTQAIMFYFINTPPGHGITSINTYISAASFAQDPLFDGQGVVFSQKALINVLDRPFYLINQTPTGSSIATGITIGVIGGTQATSDFYQLYGGASNILFGVTATSVGTQATFTSNYGNGPQFSEIYQNRLFLSGFSAMPSTVQFSQLGQPKVYEEGSDFELRTNDGDIVSAMKAYQGKLVLFKVNSFHELSGDNPDNFIAREVSSEYGCLTNRAITTYENSLLFLDRKGVILYNGAQIQPVSNRIQPVFDRMNVTAAKSVATMVHDKRRNQVMLGLPVDGATFNNLTVVYDYIADAWTTYNGFNPSVYAVIQGSLSNKAVFYGSYSGMFFNFGSSLIGDNGSGYTCLLQTRFYNQFGQTTEGQFRRLYMNVDPISSATVALSINFMQNYGTSFVLSRTMFANPFQSRIDFGISARSLSFNLSYIASTQAVKIHGYGLEDRYQRST